MRVLVSILVVFPFLALHGEGLRKGTYAGKEVAHAKKLAVADKSGGGEIMSVPQLINYQGFLASSQDSSPLDTIIDITFRIYSSQTGGTELWSETHSNVQVTRGIFNVLLGSVNPIPRTIFDGSTRYLQVEIGTEVLSPRKPLVSVPYSFRSWYADTASVTTGSAVYADSAGHLVGPDTVRANVAGAPVLFLKNHSSSGNGLGIKGGYYGVRIDSTSNYGVYVNRSGDDGIYVNHPGDAGVVIWSPTNTGVYVYNAGYRGVTVQSASDNGVHVNSAGGKGVYVGSAQHGFYVNSADSEGIYVNNTGEDGVYVDNAGDDGVYVSNAGDYGIYVYYAGWAGVRAEGHKYGALFYSDTTSTTLFVRNYHGYSSSDTIARFKAGPVFNSFTRFYFLGDGNAYAAGNWNTFRKNSKGEYESFSAVQAERQELIAHGTGRLENGVAHVSFGSSFSEFVTRSENIEITVTPVGSYSGLYIADRSPEGFTVKSGAGDPNCEFTWIAIAVEKGKEKRAKVGNIDEEERLTMKPKEERHSIERDRKVMGMRKRSLPKVERVFEFYEVWPEKHEKMRYKIINDPRRGRR